MKSMFAVIWNQVDENFGRVILGIIGGFTVWLITNWRKNILGVIWLEHVLKVIIILLLAFALTIVITVLNIALP